mmetsp:Transcript_17809/g.40909  ORF Transcript_17809/g.40909 Transcript_17809/m.40909 type:complete len:352 (+) Transcript_17809:711-1766(+)
MLLHALLVAQTHEVGDLRGNGHADGDGLAVQQRSQRGHVVLVALRRVPREVLDRVPNRVAVLRHHLVEVRLVVPREGRHLRLDAHAADRGEVVRVPQHGLALLDDRLDDHVDELLRLREAVLQRLGDAVERMTRRERAEGLGVDHNLGGGVVRAKQVLAEWMVHRLLEVDGGVEGAHRRGGDVDEGNAAVEGGGEEAAHVVDDAAAERDDARVLRDALREDLIGELVEDLAGLHRLGRRLVALVTHALDDELGHLDAGRGEADHDLVREQVVADGVGDQVVLRGEALLRQDVVLADLREQAVLDEDVGVEGLRVPAEAVCVHAVLIDCSAHEVWLRHGCWRVECVLCGEGA